MSTPTHSVSVAGVVVDPNGKILVIRRRDNGHWEPPGGILEFDETPQEGAVREILEETGFRVSVDRLTGVYKNMEQTVVALVFRCSPLNIEASPSASETSTAKWVNHEEIDKLMNEAYAVRVHDAFDTYVPVRTHDGTHLIPTTEA